MYGRGKPWYNFMIVSPRYYIYSFVIVLVLTVLISWVRQTRTKKEFFKIMGWVVVYFAALILMIAGLSQLLVVLGIAEAGFIL